MKTPQPTTAQEICEHLLTEEIRYNIEHDILPSESTIANRLLQRGIELRDAYEELQRKLHAHPPALHCFLGLVLNTAAFWSPDQAKEARAARNDLADVNRQIAKTATELALLLEQRSNLHDMSGFSSDTHFHVCDVIDAASQHNYLFQSYVQKELAILRCQFNLNYWPSLDAFVQELALDAKNSVMNATDPLTAAATAAARPSRADFFKALFAAIEESRAENSGQLPIGFKLTDRTLASLANCALDLGPDDLVDEEYVKHLRQRERERKHYGTKNSNGGKK